MESNRFFLYLNRINSLLLMLLFITLIAGSLFSIISSLRLFNPYEPDGISFDTTNPDTQQQLSFELSDLESVYGQNTHILFARYQKNPIVLGSIDYNLNYTNKNILFINDDEKEPQWLFEGNQQSIIEYQQLTSNNPDYLTHFFYYIIADKDTNNDNEINNKDKLSVAISRYDGKNYQLLADNITHIYSFSFDEKKKQLRLLLKTNQQRLYQTYSLDDASLINEKVISLNQ